MRSKTCNAFIKRYFLCETYCAYLETCEVEICRFPNTEHANLKYNHKMGIHILYENIVNGEYHSRSGLLTTQICSDFLYRWQPLIHYYPQMFKCDVILLFAQKKSHRYCESNIDYYVRYSYGYTCNIYDSILSQ